MKNRCFQVFILMFLYVSCNKNLTTFQILSMEKIKSFSVDTSFSYRCSGWKLNEADIEFIILNSEVVGSQEIDFLFNTLPCEYVGELIYKNENYKFMVNAGSYSVLYNKDTTIYFGLFKSNNYFITPPEEGTNE